MSEEKLRYFLNQVTANLHETRRRLQEIESAAGEPIAILGVGCRFPGGARSPDELWDLLAAGQDAVSGFPQDRGWELDGLYDPDPDRLGTSYTQAGGFVYDVADFDAGFFGISPREALAMDPQQRLLLETSWEAFERAGIVPASLRGSRTGVYVGSAQSGYGSGFGMPGLPKELEGHLSTGIATSVMSGRVSYSLGLVGPAVTVDTACSSALVALHLACGALRAGDCTLALVAGVSVTSTPAVFVWTSRQRGLAADGRCKAFSAAADGMGMSEGIGVLLAERLSDAQKNGHPVLAVIRGSAINQDGASNGLTAPNGPSQQRVIQAALAAARLSADQVDAVEAHGSGTTLGDPIEAQALLATYGQDRPQDRPLWLGSVKSNIGHPQAAAGMAGVLKMALAIQHGLLPRTLHADEPSPHIDWSSGAVRLLTEARPWPEGQLRRGGVSSFGMSGTNVHVILEEAPSPGEYSGAGSPPVSIALPEATLPGVMSWLVSARSADGLRAQAGRLAAHLTARPELDPVDVGWSLATTRSVFEHRAVVLGPGREELAAGLAALAAGQPVPLVLTGVATDLGKVVFVFPGQGSQWEGMGRELAGCCPVFAERLAECGRALAPHVPWSLEEVIAGAPGAPGLEAAEVVQPVLWAVMVSLAAIWQAAGVTPDAVVGHSQGEIAAATVAGILSLEDAARVVAARSRALSGLGDGGAMVSVVMPEGRVRELMSRWGDRLAVAAVNGPAATVVSGELDALTEFEAELSARHAMRWRVPETDFVAHSSRVEELAGPLAEELASIAPQASRVRLFSTALGRWMDGAELDAGYWYENVRRTVRFEDATRALTQDGYRTFVEVSPHPTLEAAVEDTIEDTVPGLVRVVCGTLHRDFPATVQLSTVMARGFARGMRMNWAAMVGAGQQVELPTYAFQRQRYWPEGGQESAPVSGDLAGNEGEARFWAAVEGGDLQVLASTLAVDDQRLGEILPALASWRRRELDRSVTGSWRYRISWVPVSEPDRAALSGTWLVVVPAAQAAREPGHLAGGEPGHLAAGEPGQLAAGEPGQLVGGCVRALETYGARAVILEVASAELDRGDLAARIGEAMVDGVAGVVSLLALDEVPLAGFPVVPAGLAGSLVLVQALGDAGVCAPLWVLTCGAVAAGPGEVLASPVQAQVCGLARVAAQEYPDLRGGLVDVPPVLDERTAGRLCAVLAGCGEGEVAIRGAGIMGRRLVRAPLPAEAGEPWTPRGSVLVTGGSGALAGHAAGWLAAQGALRVVLASRSGPGAVGGAARAAELAGAGSGVEVLACDVGVRAEVAGVLARIAAAGPPLTGVLHTAGVLDDGVLDALGPDRLASVLAAKAGGAAHLDELTRDMALEQFVLFSSSAATFGGPGQGNYTAANAYLDALAQRRAACGLAGLSIAWGPWLGGGVAQASEAVVTRLRRGPLPEMDPGLAVKALEQALEGRDSLLGVMDVDWAVFASAPGATEVPLVRDLPDVMALAREPSEAGDGEELAAGELARRLAGVPRAEQDRMLTDLIRGQAAEVLGHSSAAAVDPDRAFSELGLDSLTTLEMRQRMSIVTSLRLSATLLFDYPTPAVLAGFLRGELVGDQAAVAEAPAAPAVAADGDPVAIVAMSCRYPGGVRNPEDLWELLAAGGDAISGLPVDRGWDVEALYDPDPSHEGTAYAREGGFVHEAGEFDPGFFAISPREAMAMDPQQRLVLEMSWEALERAGIDPASLRGSPTGVFVGGYTSGYVFQLALQGAGEFEGHLMTGNATSVLSGRVSYTLGLEGPAVTMDTACSSSLVALHMAAQALRSGECSLALVGGVTIMATPGDLVSFSRQRGLAADGRCKAFSAAADGMGMSEGAGMIVVERLSDARRNGHPVLAVVAGSAVNSDGASNGLTAPNGPSQQRVIRAALASAGVSAADIDVVEAHGTGTELGDPIEAQALIAAYGQDRPAGRPLWLGTVKSNIGHTQAAAGVAGLIKVVLALQHQQLPRTLHVDEPSPHVDWAAGALRLLTGAAPWERNGRPRRAGVSSFGISGTNAHIILEEPPVAEADAPAAEEQAAGDGAAGEQAAGDSASGRAVPMLVPGPTPWLVSGRTTEGLRAQAGRLAAHLAARQEAGPTYPADVAWSLATTRSSFGHRAVIMGTDREDLAAGLAALAAGPGVSAPGVITGNIPAGGTVRVGFLFAGQGSQRAGMGAELHAASPVFAAAFDRACALLEAELGVPVAEVVLGQDTGDERADQTMYAQAGLFAVEAGLVALLAAAGVTPDAVAGHSVGEVAAAYAAGVLSLEDACRLVAARGRLMQALPGGGAMTAIAATESEVSAALEGIDGVSVAAVNGPSAVVISGDADAVERVAGSFRDRGVQVQALRVSHAFHSHRMDPVLEELGQVTAALDAASPRVPWAGALTGELLATCEPGYWVRQAREPVRFAEAVAALAAQGISVFIEIGPDGTLSALGPEVLGPEVLGPEVLGPEVLGPEALGPEVLGPAVPGEDAGAVFIPVLRSGRSARPAAETVTAALARAHVRGVGVDWAAVLGGGQRVDLPTYAFQRQRYWPQGPRSDSSSAVLGGDGAGTAAETRFWAAVEGGDMRALAETLGAGDSERLGDVLPLLATWRRRERDRSAIEGWRYRISWIPVAEPDRAALAGTWLLVVLAGPAGQPGPACARALEARGGRVVVVEVGRDELDRETLAARIGPAAAIGLAGIVSLLALEEAPLPAEPVLCAGLAGTQVLVQVLGDAGVAAPLWVLTRGAVAAGPGEVLARPVQAQAWGLGRVVGLEHPDRWGGLIDLPPVLDERAAGRLAAVLAGCGEDQVAIRDAGILARRLVHTPQNGAGQNGAGQNGAGQRWVPGGSVLITGGTGAIGGHVARWLAGRGAPWVVLASRSGPAAPGAAPLAANLAAAGTGAEVIACDSADRAGLAGLLDRIEAGGQGSPRLAAVMHAAGRAQDTALADSTTPELAEVLAAKAAGAAYLDELTADLDLEQFVLFSSIAATWGSGLQPGYAAANAFLDALAEARRGRGLAAASVAWGPWGGRGMTDAEAAQQLQRRGLLPMDPQLAIGALAQLLDGGHGPVTVADVDWARFAPPFTLRRSSPLIENLPEVGQALASLADAAADDGPAAAGAGTALRQQLAALPPAEQDRLLVNLIRAEAAAVLGHSSAEAAEELGDFGPGRAFRDLGFDSLTAVELRDRLTAATGLRLPATLVFDFPTPVVLAGYLRAEAFPARAAAIPLATELDKLDSLLSEMTLADEAREMVTARLRGFLSKWESARPESQPAAARIESATDDEIFKFIHKELGRS